MSQQANDPFMEEQEHVRALLESTRGELQNAVRQWEYYRDKTVEYSIANEKFAELSRYALSELRHVMWLLSEGSNFSTARAHIRGLVRRFECGSKDFQYDETPSASKRSNQELIEHNLLTAKVVLDEIQKHVQACRENGETDLRGILAKINAIRVQVVQQSRLGASDEPTCAICGERLDEIGECPNHP